MKIIGWIRMHDKASCGATVLEGSLTEIVLGRPQAFQGAKMSCQKRCIISDGYPATVLGNKRCAVYHGMQTSGGCPLESTVNDFSGVGNDDGEEIGDSFIQNAGGDWVPVFLPRKAEDCEYDQHVVLEDQDGRPLENIPYRLIDACGAVLEGVSGADGHTQAMAGNEGEALDAAIAHKDRT